MPTRERAAIQAQKPPVLTATLTVAEWGIVYQALSRMIEHTGKHTLACMFFREVQDKLIAQRAGMPG